MLVPAMLGYSAKVNLELHIGTACYQLAQIGADRMIFDRDVNLPGTSGEVRVQIDEHEKRLLATWEASETPRRVVWATFQRLV